MEWPFHVCFLGLLASTAVIGQRICRHEGISYDSASAVTIVCDNAATPPELPLLADFNGDGRTDLFCNKPDGAADQYFLASISGAFYASKDPRTGGWCVLSEGEMMAGDVNGDGKADLICRFNDGRKFQVSYYNGGRFMSPRSLKVALECPMTSSLHIGDVSGDRAVDFVCFDQSAGKVRIHYNGAEHRYRRHTYDPRLHSHFAHPGYYEMDGTFCPGANQIFKLADFDGDKKQDLMCYDPAPTNGVVQIALAKAHGHFDKVMSISLSNRLCTTLIELLVTDVNGDGMADLVCLEEAADLVESIQFFEHRGNTFVQDTTDAFGVQVFAGTTCPAANTHAGDFNGDGLNDLACIVGTNPFLAKFATCRT